jgi:hypothetical protein
MGTHLSRKDKKDHSLRVGQYHVEGIGEILHGEL